MGPPARCPSACLVGGHSSIQGPICHRTLAFPPGQLPSIWDLARPLLGRVELLTPPPQTCSSQDSLCAPSKLNDVLAKVPP
eukprot:CAMPEP_0202864570 /NCGR_PEP_ID=MMETSP1391-20130828/4758_1 /ASSEMBLY_ACC=CAM_ASM_000867 /TAXON_ID=1034604 /ORGANISM="Chlamydomonas leiostraca, Strain SAG 11-49" /LENGTH=80 /DNA_ID=CAMNT_0049544327 /DNA_START=822 /DNA_END=1064 /DNA_ORIENTATION=+